MGGMGALRVLKARWARGCSACCTTREGKFFLPVGVPGYDAWSLLWYQPWAANPDTPRELWRRATVGYDWSWLGKKPADIEAAESNCCRSLKVHICAIASFLAAAARACGDPERADKIEPVV